MTGVQTCALPIYGPPQQPRQDALDNKLGEDSRHRLPCWDPGDQVQAPRADQRMLPPEVALQLLQAMKTDLRGGRRHELGNNLEVDADGLLRHVVLGVSNLDLGKPPDHVLNREGLL